jgi:hypothetical protein
MLSRCALAMCLMVPMVAPAVAFELPLEAEHFQLEEGWKVTDYGYFPSQPNLFSLRKIEADETDSRARAVRDIEVPRTADYNLWVRYESCYGFGSVFSVSIYQDGVRRAHGVFGRMKDRKYFPFGRGLTVQRAWMWHSADYVYQGMPARLDRGPARVVIEKARNEQPAARRVVDLLYLTDDLTLRPGDDWDWRGDVEPPILSRFTVPLYVRARVLEGEGTVGVKPELHLLGYYKGPQRLYYASRSGLLEKPPAEGEALAAGEEMGWQRVDVPTAMPIAVYLWQNGTAKAEVELALRSPENSVKKIVVGPDQERQLVFIAIGMRKYEDGLLGDHRALTFGELCRKQADIVKAYPVRGKPAERLLFLGCLRSRDEFDLARACGINAEAYGVLAEIYGASPRWQGFLTAHGFISLQNEHLTQECYEGDYTALEAAYKAAAEKQRQDLGRDLPVSIKLLEETGPPDIETLMGWPKVKAQFEAYLAEQGLSLAQAQQDPDVLFYESNRFRTLLFARVNAEATRLLEKHYPPGTRVNSGSVYPSTGGAPGLARGDDIFMLFRERGVTEFSSEITWGLNTPEYVGPQVESYEAALARSLAKYHNCPLGTYLIADGNRGYTGDFVETASYALFSQGFSWVHCYSFGWPGECCFLGYPDVLKGIKRASHAIGAAEDALLSGKVAQAPIAIGWSSTTDIWDLARPQAFPGAPGNCVYPQERCNLYLLLRHLQYPVDILSEEDLSAGYLAGYKVFFLVGDHLRPEAAEALRRWVEAGGTLISVAGGGLYDHYNRPLDTLKPVFGITAADLSKQADAIRPKLELLHMEPLDTITFTSDGLSGKTMDVYGYRQGLVAGEGTVLGRFANGEAAAVTHEYGKGRAVILGALPGPAYIKPAIPLKPFGRGGENELMNFVPTAYASEVADIVASFLSDVDSPVRCSERLVEAVLMRSDDRYVIPLLNYGLRPVKSLEVTLRLDNLGRVVQVTGTFTKPKVGRGEDGATIIRVPIDRFECLTVTTT